VHRIAATGNVPGLENVTVEPAQRPCGEWGDAFANAHYVTTEGHAWHRITVTSGDKRGCVTTSPAR
jgi:hypothetical protein